jgi:hypothetical protein
MTHNTHMQSAQFLLLHYSETWPRIPKRQADVQVSFFFFSLRPATEDGQWDLDGMARSGRRERKGGRECRICQTHAGVRGFPAGSGEVAGFSSRIRPKPGLGRFGLDRTVADGLVIGVGFNDCYGLELTGFFVLIV